MDIEGKSNATRLTTHQNQRNREYSTQMNSPNKKKKYINRKRIRIQMKVNFVDGHPKLVSVVGHKSGFRGHSTHTTQHTPSAIHTLAHTESIRCAFVNGRLTQTIAHNWNTRRLSQPLISISHTYLLADRAFFGLSVPDIGRQSVVQSVFANTNTDSIRSL